MAATDINFATAQTGSRAGLFSVPAFSKTKPNIVGCIAVMMFGLFLIVGMNVAGGFSLIGFFLLPAAGAYLFVAGLIVLTRLVLRSVGGKLAQG